MTRRGADGPGSPSPTCRWVCDDDDANCWAADCAPDLLYTFNEGAPRDSHFRFCPYCGKPLVEVPYAAVPEEE